MIYLLRNYHLTFDEYNSTMKTINKPSTSIKKWALEDRPREKLMQHGASTLSNAELLAILINNGHKNKSAVALAREVMALGGNSLAELGRVTMKQILGIKGIGPAKAISIAAALELGRRRQVSEPMARAVVRTSNDIAKYLRPMLKDYPYEVFAVIFLNRACKVKHFEVISRGGITHTIADPRIILKRAVEAEATALILCHNHPSGNLKPSKADTVMTQKIKQAASFFDIEVTDHIIVSEDGYFSFADGGMI
jgi:DNA repair protein RadC